MPHEVRAVVAAKRGAPVELQTILVPDPGPGEVLVSVQACGVCHTDLHYRDGAINDAFPFLLGHEAAGTVDAVGPGVTDLAPGDYVVLAWRAPCGNCRSCRRGRPWYCFDSRNATQPMTLLDVGSGDTVAVIGCGGVGNAAIAGASIAGARRVIAVDIDERKLDGATRFGATDTVNSRGADPVEAVRDLTGGHGADVVIDAVGRPETYRQGFYMRDLAGTLVQVGVPDPEMKIELPLIDLFGRGGALKSSWYGDCLPSRDFPVLIDRYLSGRLDLDGFVTETIGLDEVESAFDKMRDGRVLRSVVVL
ncbi:zinc-binding dehydrogenase [Streptomyces lydicus]|uniref:zinc-binding dehydrogenase n=1 Tax=Streptomyces lydicus TaxID=47763 RepID=UPI000527CA5C|nr:zinc-binding dehydrogenase [Streptomyces lydicus]